ncbi:PhoH family protein [Luteibaculum oceani]|uniref:PhoH family protein n=1 Tax=Luteibaculum oceani TaxID=1294296 RepID=A0A5C6VFJ2_9FLAO|nr:PhoH family protein [Luteibaculum oceani]TXC82118.1 PhoH family protein [Luteibaculum oceani]
MPRTKKTKKLFVLDTSVILHDHRSIHEFEEHDVAIPIMVLEELDNFKRGNESKNFEAREFIRIIDRLSEKNTLNNWITLDQKRQSRFKIHFTKKMESTAERSMGQKADHKILDAALELQEENKDRITVLVTKDINLRLKAKALGLQAEDYETGKVKVEMETFKGIETINDADPDAIRQVFKDKVSDDLTVLNGNVKNNQFYIVKNGSSSLLAYYNPLNESVERVEKQFVYGIKPKNAEQAFAIHALMNNNIKLVTITGVAGTGKTLIALASALEQRNNYNQIVLARPIVPLSNKEIGFLPGSAHDKVNPYMAPLWDNLSYIKNQFKETEKKYQQIMQMQEEGRIVVSPLAFIRGRSLTDVIFIIDEAQNLTPHEVKTIVTRAGDNTKLVFTGDVRQIDTPYLDEHSNGLTYLIDRLQGQDLYAHIHLEKGERSELANLANEML